MRRIFSILIMLAMFATMLTFSAAAASALDVQYSIDNGKTYQSIPGFDPSVLVYDDIRLPDNVFTVKLKAVMPDAGTWWTTVSSYWREGGGSNPDPFNPIVGHALLGDFYTQIPLPGYGWARYIEGKTNDNNIPISLEEVIGYVNYKAEGASNATKYAFSFRSIQPRLIEYNINTNVITGPLPFLSGAAAFNDNRSILDSAAAGSAKDGATRSWALANLSTSLEGASMFVLPLTNMIIEGSGAESNPTAELFNFKADTAGEIVVLTTNDVSADSMYRTVGTQWQAGDGSGNAPNGITTFSAARNKNNYNNITYAALVYKWISSNKSDFPATNQYNAYRLDTPGINNGNIVNNTHVKDNTKLTYSYVKSFNAGESVSVGNIGTITASSAEKEDIIAVFVIWDTEPKITVNSAVAINYGGDLYVITNTSSVNTAINEQDMYVAIYSGLKMIGVKKIPYSDGENEFLFNNITLHGDERIKIIALEPESLKHLITSDYSYTLADILIE